MRSTGSAVCVVSLSPCPPRCKSFSTITLYVRWIKFESEKERKEPRGPIFVNRNHIKPTGNEVKEITGKIIYNLQFKCTNDKLKGNQSEWKKKKKTCHQWSASDLLPWRRVVLTLSALHVGITAVKAAQLVGQRTYGFRSYRRQVDF